MKVGDVLVYGNGERAEIVGFPDVNGAPGVMLAPDVKPLGASEVFRYRSEIEKWVALKVWALEVTE